MQKPTLSIKEILKLEKKRYRDELGVFLIEGKKVFSEARLAKAPVRQILVTDKFVREQQEFLKQQHIGFHDMVVISEQNAFRLSDTKTPSGLFAVVEKPSLHLSEVLTDPFIAVFENVRDPGNLGTMIRTADWFGIKSVVVSDGADPYNDKVIRSTMGSLFHMKVYQSSSLINDLQMIKKTGFQVVVTRPEKTGQQEMPPLKKKICLIMGNESVGTSEEVDALADTSYAIARFGQAESLNVAVSFGIILNEISPHILK